MRPRILADNRGCQLRLDTEGARHGFLTAPLPIMWAVPGDADSPLRAADTSLLVPTTVSIEERWSGDQLGWAAGEEGLQMTCKLLQVDISGRWCTICRTHGFELAFAL